MHLTSIPIGGPTKALRDKIAVAWQDPPILLKMLSFAMVGAINASVDFSVFIFCYKALGFPLIASNAVSWVAAVSISYVLNSTITFRKQSGRTLRWNDFLRFAASGLIVETLATGVLIFLSHHTTIVAAKILSLAIGFGFNFSMSNFFIFRRPHAS
jgi:putative flippase GtrA